MPASWVNMASQAYLTCYNIGQTIGWTAALAATLRSIMDNGGSFTSVYSQASWFVHVFQVASVMEVFHAGLKLTRSPMSAALMQWMGRTHVLMAVTHAIPTLQHTPAAGVLFLAWALTEVIRYPSYALSQHCPRWLNWLRYTVFIPLYPIGALSEMKLMYDGIPTMRAKKMYSITMPNAYNFAFDYPTFVSAVLVAYPFLFYSLYAYMFVQRKKKLGGASSSDESKKKKTN